MRGSSIAMVLLAGLLVTAAASAAPSPSLARMSRTSSAAAPAGCESCAPAAAPAGAAGGQERKAVCVPSDTTMCLNGGMFAVSATYRAGDGSSGQAHTVQLTDDTGYLWFFNSANVEVILKVLTGCGLNQHYWVFAGGLTNVRVDITVASSLDGAKRYQNPLNTPFQPIQDTAAFPCAI